MSETSNQRAPISSAIVCRDPMAELQWLENAFGFETALLITEEDGRLAHSEMRFGDGCVMVGNEWTENMKAPGPLGAITQRISVHLPSGVDAHCERARAAGARMVMEPRDEPYGVRMYVAVDPEGHTWDFSEPREFSEEGMAAAGMAVRRLAEEPEARTFFPDVYYQDARAAIEWLEKAFGFQPTMVIEGGGAVRGHLAFDGYQVAVGSEWSSEGQPRRLSPRSLGGANTQTIHVQLRDGIDAHCERARAAGATIVAAPEDQFYGDRTYRALDPEGHLWTFGQTLRVTTPQEWEAETGLKTTVYR